jgi:hypothetical protein
MSRIFAALGISLCVAALSTATYAASSYPPNVYFAFGSAVIENEIKVNSVGAPVGWQCGNFNLVSDNTGLEPSQFKGSGSTAAKMFLALGEYDYNSNSDLTSVLQYGDGAVLTFTSPTGGALAFNYGIDQKGGVIGTNLSFPFTITNMKVGPNNAYYEFTMEVQLTNCTVTVVASYYSEL